MLSKFYFILIQLMGKKSDNTNPLEYTYPNNFPVHVVFTKKFTHFIPHRVQEHEAIH
jgi:hypothetical protein